MATAEAILASAASYSYTEIIIAAITFLLILYFPQRNGLPFNWPLIGMLPTCFPLNLHICDHLTKLMELCYGTLVFKGPWFANRDMIVTTDPRNVHHVLCTNFSSYPRGPDTRRIFEAYGEFLFTSDLDIWRRDRKLAHAFFHDPRLHDSTTNINREIIENGLIPVLDHASEHGHVIDLQDVIERYMLDATCMMITGYNHGSLHVGLPEDAVLSALHNANSAILMRHILPESTWELQSWLGIGVEKKHRKACKVLDDVAEHYIESWKEQTRTSKYSKEDFYAINIFYKEKELLESMGQPDKVMRDIVKGLIIGGTDTISPVLPWFFWILSKNPIVEFNIKKEIEANIESIKSGDRLIFLSEELNKLIYLHGALCETLRLFPSAPFLPKTCIEPDILPSGHRVNPGIRIILFIYGMGRMKSVWGEDCLEFKPERWISERGAVKPMASNKFTAFGSGPRICMGKNMAFIRLKAVAATILYNYQIQMVKNQPVPTPANSIFLRMKHGLLAKITRRTA